MKKDMKIYKLCELFDELKELLMAQLEMQITTPKFTSLVPKPIIEDKKPKAKASGSSSSSKRKRVDEDETDDEEEERFEVDNSQIQAGLGNLFIMVSSLIHEVDSLRKEVDRLKSRENAINLADDDNEEEDQKVASVTPRQGDEQSED